MGVLNEKTPKFWMLVKVYLSKFNPKMSEKKA